MPSDDLYMATATSDITGRHDHISNDGNPHARSWTGPTSDGKAVHIAYCLPLMETRFMLRAEEAASDWSGSLAKRFTPGAAPWIPPKRFTPRAAPWIP